MLNLRLERTSFFSDKFFKKSDSEYTKALIYIIWCVYLHFFHSLWHCMYIDILRCDLVSFSSVRFFQFLAPKCVYCSCKRWPVRFVSDYISERLVLWVNAGAQTFKKPSPLNRTETKTKNHQHIHTKVTQLETFLPYYEGKHDIAMATINVAICDSLMQRHFEIYEKWATEPCDEGNIKAKWKKILN